MASSYRQTFDKLCRVIRTSTVDLLEFRSVESGETSVMICAVKPMSAGQLEYQPLATMHACPMGPILLPGTAGTGGPRRWPLDGMLASRRLLKGVRP